MENNITIVDAIKTVLQDSSEGMTSQEIYNKIVERKLYAFGAKTPEAAVHAKLRVYCRDLDFPSSSPTKYFYLKKRTGKTNYYALINPESKEDNFQKELIQDDSENEMLAEEKNNDKSVIFGFEEPETFLHPETQTLLYNKLIAMTENGYQVMITTHAPNIVAETNIGDIIFVQKNGTDYILRYVFTLT